MDLLNKMREEWDQRAKEDAYYYAAFSRRRQSDEEFYSTASETVSTLETELTRLSEGSANSRSALEIGCGPGRLMRALSHHFGSIQGVDISPQMIAIARNALVNISHASVHVTPHSDLSMIENDTLDFIYSYTVFQHIPSREIVLNYLHESRRVLKPGGIMCCQLRGTPPLATELGRETDTWTGCYFDLASIVAFSLAHDFQLVAISGANTQYMWTTWRKPYISSQGGDLSGLRLTAVTASKDGSNRVPQLGPDACISLWVAGVPEGLHLANSEVVVNGFTCQGCYLSPWTRTGGAQLNAYLPQNTPLGLNTVELRGLGRRVPEVQTIDVFQTEFRPVLKTVTDAICIGSKYLIETGGVKVTLQGIEECQNVSFRIDGRATQIVQIELKDKTSLEYEYSFYLPRPSARGKVELEVLIGIERLQSVTLTVA